MHVNCWLLNFDLHTFQAENPNDSGVFTVSMQFGSVIVEVSPGWDQKLRGANTYHIQVKLSTGEDSTELSTRPQKWGMEIRVQKNVPVSEASPSVLADANSAPHFWGRVLRQAEHLIKVSVDNAYLDSGSISTTLVGVEVYGTENSPQLISFLFPCSVLRLAVGYSGDVILLGDGDEILVFSDEQWKNQVNGLPENWALLWRCLLDDK